MKVLLIMMMLVFGNAVRAQDFNHEELFSPQENAKIVNAIDFICGDIWCEGYYEYKFLNISCDKNSHQCDLSFQFKESINDREVLYSPIQVCHIGEVNSIDQIMKDDQYLKFEFIDKLSSCFGDLADSYRGH